MLFLEPPPADMLPPAGHRAGPGRDHTGPIARSGRPGGRPRVLPRAAAAAAEAKAAPQSRSNSSSRSRPPRSSRPRRGGRGPGGRAGTGPESQCGRNPGLESAGPGGPECPGPQAGPQEGHRDHESLRPDLWEPAAPHSAGGYKHPRVCALSARGRAHARRPGGHLAPELITFHWGSNEAGATGLVSAPGSLG